MRHIVCSVAVISGPFICSLVGKGAFSSTDFGVLSKKIALLKPKIGTDCSFAEKIVGGFFFLHGASDLILIFFKKKNFPLKWHRLDLEHKCVNM